MTWEAASLEGGPEQESSLQQVQAMVLTALTLGPFYLADLVVLLVAALGKDSS